MYSFAVAAREVARVEIQREVVQSEQFPVAAREVARVEIGEGR